MPVIRHDSLDHPELDMFRSLKQQNATRDAGVFVAEGATVVERVLRSQFDVHSLLVSDRKWEAVRHKLPENVPIHRLSNQLAQQLIGYPFHCGVMACAHRKPAPRLATVVRSEFPGLIIAGDRIVDPENVGALIRIASAFGADAVLLGPGSADPFSRRVLRVSMGNVLFLPVIETTDLGAAVQELRTEHSFHACAALLGDNCVDLAEFHFPQRSVLVVGNEYDGISDTVTKAVDSRLMIPMSNGTDSLNVAIATAIFAWQYRACHPA